MSERRRKFWGWGYEDDAVPAEELAWFEQAWSKLLGIKKFDVTPPPRIEEITLRAPRISPPASLSAISTSVARRVCRPNGKTCVYWDGVSG